MEGVQSGRLIGMWGGGGISSCVSIPGGASDFVSNAGVTGVDVDVRALSDDIRARSADIPTTSTTQIQLRFCFLPPAFRAIDVRGVGKFVSIPPVLDVPGVGKFAS